MSEADSQKKPPIQLKPCVRCGQFVPEQAPSCWVCNYPHPPKVIKQQGLSIIWQVIISILLAFGAVIAMVVALFFLCIYALSGGFQ